MTTAARRRTNLALLLLTPLAVLTGLFSNAIGVDWAVDPATIHGVVAVAILLLAPWKSAVVRRGLARRRSTRWLSVGLLFLIAVTAASGLLHSATGTRSIGPLTVMQIHIGSGLGALLLVWLHYRSHPIRVRQTDLGRRAFLGAAGLSAAAVALWGGWEILLRATGAAGADRRFTGSHERGSFAPAEMPVTSWLDDRVQHIDAADWRLNVRGAELTLGEVQAAGVEDVTAILDCTGGWYSEQLWSGVRLDRLLTTSERSVVVRSATGYSRRFPTRDLDKLWLVTGIGGSPLSAGHGFPARLVAPGRRGYWWVKWVVAIESSPVPWWWQLPFPVT